MADRTHYAALDFASPRRSAAFALPVAWLGLLALLTGCASTELRAYKEAKSQYEACLEEFPNAKNRCDVLEDAARRRYAEYESNSKNRWGGSGSWRDRDSPWGRE